MTPPMTPITPFSSPLPATPPRHGAVLPPAMTAAAMAPLSAALSAGRAAGVRARGHFICDASLQALTSAPWFGELGRQTPISLTIRRCGGPARADTVRGAFAFDVRFHEGGPDAQEARPAGRPGRVAWCLQACSLPLCLHGPLPEPWRDDAPLAPWLWLMSDRALPRSWRMMQGFGTRTWRLVPAAGAAPVFACFHWLPAAGTHALAADEAEQLALADPQFLQRDLRDALAARAAPAWTLALQVFSERQAMLHGIDPHDPGPLLPHDWAPLRNVGRLVLTSLADPATPAVADEDAEVDDEHASAPGLEACTRAAPRWPDDDLQQARLFWRSQSGTEQQHLAQACRAACAALREPALRARLRERLALVDAALVGPAPPRPGPADAIVLPVLTAEPPPGQPVMPTAGAPAGATATPDRGPEPAALLSLLARPGERSVRLRRVALLLAEGFEPRSLRSLQRVLRLAGARPQCVGVQAGAFCAEGGGLMLAEASVESAPSVLWDAVVLPAGAAAQAALARSPAVARFVQEQYRHGKPILQLGGDQGLLARLGIPPVLPDGRSDPALLRRVGGDDELDQRRLVRAFLEALALPRRFDRGPACVPRPEPPGVPAGAH